MLHAFLTFFSQPTGDMFVQLFGTIFFGLFVIGSLFALFDFAKQNPTTSVIVVIFIVVCSVEEIRNGAIITGAVGVYAAGALLTAIAAAMATPVFWLIVIALLVANKN